MTVVRRTLLQLLAVLVPACLLLACTTAAQAAGPANGGTATGTFVVTSSSNPVYATLPGGATLTRFSANDEVSGSFVGTGKAEATMLNRPDGSTSHTGLILFTGELDGRSGSFVVRTTGGSDGNTSRSDWTVLEGSGTGELAGISGTGVETGAKAENWVARWTLTYRLG